MMSYTNRSIQACFLALLFAQALFFASCTTTPFEKERYGNCEDGIQNQNEEGVDCGGFCMPCADCNDGEKNGTETGIDCGGNSCISCVSGCTTPPATIDYTIYPPSFSAAYDDNATVLDSYYSVNSNYLSCSGTAMKEIRFSFKDNFDLFNYIPLNETMVFTTFSWNSSDITKNSQVSVRYRAVLGFEDYNGTLSAGQKIYFTKTGDKMIRVTFCSLTGNTKDVLSVNGILKKF